MSRLREPVFESRRRTELRNELIARARVWLPDWRPREGDADFATALFEIAARLESEVTQRLGKIPEKTFRGFLHWLGIRSKAGRAGRLPVVFSMAGAESVLAEAPVQLQGSGIDPAVTFETEHSLRVFPGSLAAVVGADASNDSFYLPAAGFSKLEAPKDDPTEWRVKSPASAGATQLQLEPELGLDSLPTLLHEPTRLQYRVTKAEGGLVTIEPPLGTAEPKPGVDPAGEPAGLNVDDRLVRVPYFDPFGVPERNRQEHTLYVGSEAVLNLASDARIQVSGSSISAADATWSYWGKASGQENPAWQPSKSEVVGGELQLVKPAGSIEVTSIAGKTSRWLRAVTKPDAARRTFPVSQLKLSVNCDPKAPKPACALTPSDKRSNIAIEGIANTTPLVLDAAFYPLGREPRLFDAFYLGCPEAFSKKNAAVEICFREANGASEALVAASVGGANETLLFGIGQDGQLHRIRPLLNATPTAARLAPIRPPFSENGTLSLVASPASLNLKQPPRLTAVSRTADVLVAMTAGPEAWLWSQTAAAGQSRWYRLGPVFDPTTGNTPVFDVDQPPEVVLLGRDDRLHAFGVNKGKLYETEIKAEDLNAGSQTWTTVDTGKVEGGTWLHIAPVFNVNSRAKGAAYADGLVAINSDGFLALFSPPGKWTSLGAIGSVETSVIPLAIRNTDTLVLVVQSGPDTVAVWTRDKQVWTDQEIDGVAVNGSFDWSVTASGELAIVFATRVHAGGAELAAWFPFTAGPMDPNALYTSHTIEGLGGAPALLDTSIVASGTHAEILVVPWKPNSLERIELKKKDLSDALLVQSPSQPYEAHDFVVTVKKSASRVFRQVAGAPLPLDANRSLLRLIAPLGDGEFQPIMTIYRRRPAPNQFAGQVTGDSTMTLALADTSANIGDRIVVRKGARRHWLVRVTGITKPPGGPWKIDVDVDVIKLAAGDVTYVYVLKGEPHPLKAHPLLDVTSLADGVVSAMKDHDIYFETAEPFRQRVLHVDVPPAPAPRFAALESAWTKHPTPQAGRFAFLLDKMFGRAEIVADAKSSTAVLSWEYWDGTAWWTIKNLIDGTGSLLHSGAVTFCVPNGLQPTDVAGRKSHWIRARLVGGDYGQERVTITSETDGKVTKQTVDRSLDDLAPPQLVSVDLRYSVCCETAPDFVLTADGGATRDQSEANRVGSANVELFMPLAETIRRASGATASAAASGDAGPGGRAIYLGFNAALKGGPISILFLIEEGEHDGAYPLQVDVLRENGFDSVVAEDGTRGLNESGVVTFDLAAPPLSTALFGQKAPFWLRLRPKAGFTAADWQPKIRSAYLNAVFAYAAETQDVERLGSSDGSPWQQVSLARPPVVEGSLELRVRELLGDQEVETLRRPNKEIVLDAVGELPGPWVLWTRVDDPDDGGKDDRVYAVNHETGEITFGDGLHGRIPPIGRDSIVAVRYKRGGGAAANKVAAWSQLNLVTPLQGVQTVAAPEGAAGGSDPQDADEVVRFAPANQSMRGRALTLRDFEMLTLQFSRDVAQARALPARAGVRLVVAMRGRNPKPSQAVQRELLRYLGERSLPMLEAQDAVTVVSPELIEVRVSLVLTITSIQDSGTVAKEANRRIVELLDPAIGGLDGTGWRLGDVPTETEIAAKLDGIDRLEEIRPVYVQRVGKEGALGAVPPLKPTQLVMLAPDGVSIQFETSDVKVPA